MTRLDRLGAGVRGLLADQRGGGAEPEAGGAPERRQQAGAHLAFDQDGVEAGQVLVLVRLQVGDLGEGAAGAGARRATPPAGRDRWRRRPARRRGRRAASRPAGPAPRRRPGARDGLAGSARSLRRPPWRPVRRAAARLRPTSATETRRSSRPWRGRGSSQAAWSQAGACVAAPESSAARSAGADRAGARAGGRRRPPLPLGAGVEDGEVCRRRRTPPPGSGCAIRGVGAPSGVKPAAIATALTRQRHPVDLALLQAEVARREMAEGLEACAMASIASRDHEGRERPVAQQRRSSAAIAASYGREISVAKRESREGADRSATPTTPAIH